MIRFVSANQSRFPFQRERQTQTVLFLPITAEYAERMVVTFSASRAFLPVDLTLLTSMGIGTRSHLDAHRHHGGPQWTGSPPGFVRMEGLPPHLLHSFTLTQTSKTCPEIVEGWLPSSLLCKVASYVSRRCTKRPPPPLPLDPSAPARFKDPVQGTSSQSRGETRTRARQ